MSSNDWRLEMDKMHANFASQITISLNHIKYCFGRSGGVFNEQFKRYFLRTSTACLELAYSKFEIEQQMNLSQAGGNDPQWQNGHFDRAMNMNSNGQRESGSNQSNDGTGSNQNTPNTTVKTEVVFAVNVNLENDENIGSNEMSVDNVINLDGGEMQNNTAVDLASSERSNDSNMVIQIDDSSDEESLDSMPNNSSEMIPVATSSQNAASGSNGYSIEIEANEPLDQSQDGKDADYVRIKDETSAELKQEQMYSFMDDHIPIIRVQLNLNGAAEENSNAANDNGSSSLELQGSKEKVAVNDQKKTAKRIKCQLCEYVCGYKSIFAQHMRSHTGEKPFPCKVCSKSFSHLTNLKRHMRIHTGEKPFACKVCSKRFNESYSLKRHMTTHKRRFPFHCKGCFRRFKVKSEKETHEKNCSNRSYECYLCEKVVTFHNKWNLENHMRHIHTGEKPFRCEICMKCFVQKSTLRKHLNTVHSRSV